MLQIFDNIQAALNWWPYSPRWYQIVGIVCLGLFVVGLAYFRFAGPTREETGERLALAQQERRFERQGFRVVSRVEGSSLLAADEKWDREAAILTKDITVAFAGREIRATLMVPYQDASWVENSVTKFEHENGTAVSLAKIFRTPEYLRRFRAAEHLVCVGLASRTSDQSNAETIQLNEALSGERSQNLCRLVAGAVGAETSITYWQLPLGYAKAAVQKSSISEKRQRTVVVIGVSGARQKELSSTIARLVMAAQLNNTTLSGYSLSTSPVETQLVPDWTSKSPMTENPLFRAVE